MPLELNPDIRTATALDFADNFGDEISTAHLLAGLITAAPAVARIADAYDLTPTVAAHVVRRLDDHWDGPDGTASAEPGPVLPKSLALTGGAAAALRQAALLAGDRECRPEVLFAAILEDDQARASATLRTCGIDPGPARQAAGDGRTPLRRDPVDEDLRPVRDRMIGRERFRGAGLRAFLFQKIFPAPFPYAITPTLWARLESEQIARQRGGARRSEDVLIAMLATYRVATFHPHLTVDVADQYDGSRRLAEAGLDHRRLTDVAATLDLGTDAVDVKTLMSRDDWPQTTGGLLARLTAHDDTRSARLLRELGFR
jgi:hypothetical protein